MTRLGIAALAVLCINLPFGYWRAGTRKFSGPWFAAVHLPLPLVIAVRLAAGLGFQAVTYPVLVGAFFTGQYLGGRLHARRRRAAAGSRQTDAGGEPPSAPIQEDAAHERER